MIKKVARRQSTLGLLISLKEGLKKNNTNEGYILASVESQMHFNRERKAFLYSGILQI